MCLLLCAIKQWSDMSFSNISLMEFALKNLASEMITGNGKHGEVIHFSKFYLLAIVSVDSNIGILTCGFLKKHCEDLIAVCNQYIKCDLSCYIGRKGFAHELGDVVDELIWINRKNVTNINKVLFIQDAHQLFDETLLPTVEELTVILQKKHRTKWFRE